MSKPGIFSRTKTEKFPTIIQFLRSQNTQKNPIKKPPLSTTIMHTWVHIPLSISSTPHLVVNMQNSELSGHHLRCHTLFTHGFLYVCICAFLVNECSFSGKSCVQNFAFQIAFSLSPQRWWTSLIRSADLQMPLQLQSNDATHTLPAWAFHSQSAQVYQAQSTQR